MTNSMRNLELAMKMRDLTAKQAEASVDKKHPPDRFAVVKSINHEERYAMVVFVGEPEDNLVRIPFGSVVPSAIGQEVKISGPADNRYISDIRGASDLEKRIEELERRVTSLTPVWGRWYVTNTSEITADLYKITFDGTRRDTPGIVQVNGLKEFQVLASGVYDIELQISYNNYLEKLIYTQVIPVTGSPYDVNMGGFRMAETGDGTITLHIGTDFYKAREHLNAGDKVCINVGSSSDWEIMAWPRTHLTISSYVLD